MRFTEIIDSLHADGEYWRVDAPADWTQGRTLFGGLQSALLLAAIRKEIGDDLPLRSLQTVFVGPVAAGPVRIRVDILRRGKSTLHAQAHTVGEQGVGSTAIAVFGAARKSAIHIRLAEPEIELLPQDAPIKKFVEGETPAFCKFVEERWARGALPYGGGEQAKIQVYLRYLDEPQITEGLVVALADTIPSPAITTLNSFAPASSMCWTLELLHDDPRSLPSGHWLMDAQVSAASDGYVYQSANLWSPDGQAVALSRQSAVIFA